VTTLDYGLDPASAIVVILALMVLVGNIVLAGMHPRKQRP
jgi:hypothetical protein